MTRRLTPAAGPLCPTFMKSLDPLALPGHILSFDFDGTLHNPADEDPVSPRLFETLERLRREKGALWGINTGRSIAHVVEGLVESRFPFAPDWVVAREREIWLPNHVGRWTAHQPWNHDCEKEQTTCTTSPLHTASSTRDARNREAGQRKRNGTTGISSISKGFRDCKQQKTNAFSFGFAVDK